jgi:WD40 repeat protein
MSSIVSFPSQASSSPASAAPPQPKRKREASSSAAASVGIASIQRSTQRSINVLTFLANRQIIPRRSLSHFPGQSQIESRVIARHIQDRLFTTTAISLDHLMFISKHEIDNGELKAVSLTSDPIDGMTSRISTVQIYNLRDFKCEERIGIKGVILKIVQLGNQFISLLVRTAPNPTLATYDFRNKRLVGSKRLDSDMRDVCTVDGKIFFMQDGKLIRFDGYQAECPLNEIDSHQMAYPINDNVEGPLRRFHFLSSDRYIVRAAQYEIAITDLKDLSRNVKIDINVLMKPDNGVEEKETRLSKKRRAESSDANAYAASSAAGAAAAASTERAITATHLDGNLLYFGTSTPKGEIEIGLVDLDTKKLVKMYPLTHKYADQVNQVFVSKDHSWLSFGDKVGDIGIVNLKTNLSFYLGRHSTTLRPVHLELNGMSHFDIHGDILVSRGEGNFKIWDLNTKTELLEKVRFMSKYSKPFFYEGSLFFYEIGTSRVAKVFTKFDLLNPLVERPIGQMDG